MIFCSCFAEEVTEATIASSIWALMFPANSNMALEMPSCASNKTLPVTLNEPLAPQPIQYVVNVPVSPFELVPDDCVRMIPGPKSLVTVGAGPALNGNGPRVKGDSVFKRVTAWEIAPEDS
jgi:hypothetical protein